MKHLSLLSLAVLSSSAHAGLRLDCMVKEGARAGQKAVARLEGHIARGAQGALAIGEKLIISLSDGKASKEDVTFVDGRHTVTIKKADAKQRVRVNVESEARPGKVSELNELDCTSKQDGMVLRFEGPTLMYADVRALGADERAGRAVAIEKQDFDVRVDIAWADLRADFQARRQEELTTLLAPQSPFGDSVGQVKEIRLYSIDQAGEKSLKALPLAGTLNRVEIVAFALREGTLTLYTSFVAPSTVRRGH